MAAVGVLLAALASGCHSGTGPPGPTGNLYARLTASAAPGAAAPDTPAPGALPPAATQPTEVRAVDPRAYASYAAGVQLAAAREWKEALARFEKARWLDPGSSRIERKIGECLERLDRPEDALAAYKRAASLAPRDFSVWFALGEALHRRGRPAEAMEAFERALDSPNAGTESADYVLTVWRLATVAASAGQRKRAIGLYDRLLALLSHPKRDYRRYREIWALVGHREFVHEELGKLHLFEGDVKAAIRSLEQGRALAPKSVTIAYRLAEAYLRDGRNDQALAEADRLLKRSGNDAAVLDLFLRAAEAAKKPDIAVQRLEERLKAAPDNFLLRFYLARSYLRTDRPVQAEQLLRTVLEAQPRSALIRAELAGALRVQKRHDAAMDVLAEAIDRGAIDRPVLIEIDRVTKALKGDTTARQVWQSAARKRPDSLGAQYLLGHVLAGLGQNEEAVSVLSRVVRKHPTFLWAYVDLTGVHIRQKQRAEALAVLDAALKTDLKREPIIHRTMAHLLDRLDRQAEAMAAVEKALAIAPDDRRSLYLKAAIFERMGKDEEAERTFRTILTADPEDPDANNALSYLFATRSRNLDEARTLVDRALRSEPKNGAYLDTLGWVLFQQGKYREALGFLKKAAEAIKSIAPDGDPVVLDHLGDAHLRLDEKGEARKAWERALELNEKDPNPEIDPSTIHRKIEALNQ